jgi:ankyrin repeat protein
MKSIKSAALCLLLCSITFVKAGDTFLLKYASEGDAGGFQGAFGLGGNINCRDGDGKTPLMLAAGYNDWIHFDTLKVILGFKPDVNLMDNSGNTAYFYAQQAGNQRGMDLLVEKGANPKLKGTPKAGGAAMDSVKSLFGIGKTSEPKSEPKIATVRKTTNTPAESVDAVKSSTPTSTPTQSKTVDTSHIEIITEETTAPSLVEVVKTGDYQKVKQALSDIKTLVNLSDQNGWSPLMYAIQMNQFDIVSLLLERGSNVQTKDSAGWTPLHLAANSGNVAVVDLLLAKSVDVNAATSKGTTPLIIASGRGYVEVVKKLLGSKALVALKDHDGKTALKYATEKSHSEVVEALKKAGAIE